MAERTEASRTAAGSSRWVTLSRACEILGVDESTLRRWADSGRLRVYRTPAGLRVLATHRTFDPSDPEVNECFRALGVDPLYARMCYNQKCFRARVSPKPWRVGIDQRLRPRPGAWPVAPEWLPGRAEWVAAYEEAARGFAACRYIDSFGRGGVHPAVRAVMNLHDALARATSELPLA